MHRLANLTRKLSFGSAARKRSATRMTSGSVCVNDRLAPFRLVLCAIGWRLSSSMTASGDVCVYASLSVSADGRHRFRRVARAQASPPRAASRGRLASVCGALTRVEEICAGDRKEVLSPHGSPARRCGTRAIFTILHHRSCHRPRPGAAPAVSEVGLREARRTRRLPARLCLPQATVSAARIR